MFAARKLMGGGGGEGSRKRSYLRNIPFEQATRSQRQAVSFGLPKVDQPAAKKQQQQQQQQQAESSKQQRKAAPQVYVRESRLAEREARRSKSIQFGQGTKTWTGLRQDRHFLDELLHQFFVLGKQFSSVDVLHLIGIDSELIGGVRALLQDLCERILEFSKSEDEGVPVLLRGGGRGMKVSIFHHPYIVSLQRVVAEAERVSSISLNATSARGSTDSASERTDSPASDADDAADDAMDVECDEAVIKSTNNNRLSDAPHQPSGAQPMVA